MNLCSTEVTDTFKTDQPILIPSCHMWMFCHCPCYGTLKVPFAITPHRQKPPAIRPRTPCVLRLGLGTKHLLYLVTFKH